MNKKRSPLWLLPMVHYAGLLLFFFFDRTSLFVTLFSLWCELVVMLLFYAGLSIRTRSIDQMIQGMGVLGGSIPLLAMQFFIACTSCISLGELDQFESSQIRNLVDLWQFVSDYHGPMIAVAISLALIYGVLTWDFIQDREPISVVESGLMTQAMLISALGLFALLLSELCGANGSMFVLNALLIARMFLQPMIRRKFRIPA